MRGDSVPQIRAGRCRVGSIGVEKCVRHERMTWPTRTIEIQKLTPTSRPELSDAVNLIELSEHWCEINTHSELVRVGRAESSESRDFDHFGGFENTQESLCRTNY